MERESRGNEEPPNALKTWIARRKKGKGGRGGQRKRKGERKGKRKGWKVKECG